MRVYTSLCEVRIYFNIYISIQKMTPKQGRSLNSNCNLTRNKRSLEVMLQDRHGSSVSILKVIIERAEMANWWDLKRLDLRSLTALRVYILGIRSFTNPTPAPRNFPTFSGWWYNHQPQLSRRPRFLVDKRLIEILDLCFGTIRSLERDFLTRWPSGD